MPGMFMSFFMHIRKIYVTSGTRWQFQMNQQTSPHLIICRKTKRGAEGILMSVHCHINLMLIIFMIDARSELLILVSFIL